MEKTYVYENSAIKKRFSHPMANGKYYTNVELTYVNGDKLIRTIRSNRIGDDITFLNGVEKIVMAWNNANRHSLPAIESFKILNIQDAR